MSENYSQPTLELSRTFEDWYLPQRPLCCDYYEHGVHRLKREDALKCRHIETNPLALSNLIVVDIDDADARLMALWEHQGMMPNLIMENPANGHAHAGWVLTYPVCRTDYARRKPLKLLHATTEGLRRSCDGDEGYSGLLMKNPLSPAWNSEIVATETYDLEQLASQLEEHGDMPPKSWKRTVRARTVGLGRNCTLFEMARLDAYREVRRIPDRSTRSRERLREYIRRDCHMINGTFPDPLPFKEVNQIAKSIDKWIVTRSRMWCDGAVINAANFTAIQSARRLKRTKKFDKKFEKYAQEVLGE